MSSIFFLTLARARAAPGAPAEDGEVRYVGLETLLLVQRRDERLDCLWPDLAHAAAVLADEMHVIAVTGQVVRGRAVIEVVVSDQPEVVEQFQRPVDRRDVDAAGRLLDGGRDLLGSGVVELADRLQHELPLRRDAVAPGPHLRGPVTAALRLPSVPPVASGLRAAPSLAPAPRPSELPLSPVTAALRLPSAMSTSLGRKKCLAQVRRFGVASGVRGEEVVRRMHSDRTCEVAVS